MTTILRELEATIFSRVRAPPPPLMSTSGPSRISSAPSTVTSSSGVSSRVDRGMPRLRARSSEAMEVGTQMTFSPSFTRAPRASMK